MLADPLTPLVIVQWVDSVTWPQSWPPSMGLKWYSTSSTVLLRTTLAQTINQHLQIYNQKTFLHAFEYHEILTIHCIILYLLWWCDNIRRIKHQYIHLAACRKSYSITLNEINTFININAIKPWYKHHYIPTIFVFTTLIDTPFLQAVSCVQIHALGLISVALEIYVNIHLGNGTSFEGKTHCTN